MMDALPDPDINFNNFNQEIASVGDDESGTAT